MAESNARVQTVIMGAAGRDFHNFNTVYREDPASEVVAFTATQIPGITGRFYPPSLAGPLYPDGIPIVDEGDLEALCRRERVGRVVFAYSDVSHATVMRAASRAQASGADFVLLGPQRTMLAARVPVIAVSAVRTGCGKSQVSRWLSGKLAARGVRVAVIRHPMPYGDLEAQAVQRFATTADLDAANCTVEEREEYEPHLAEGHVVFAGVDYGRIVEAAETESDLILWEGGNNDFPFVRPGLHLVLVDPLRPGHETAYHPGEAVLRMADIVVIAKTDAASEEAVSEVTVSARGLNPGAEIIAGASPTTIDRPETVTGRRVLVVEDGPTITHGGMPHGAGHAAAEGGGAAAIVDPRPFAAPAISAAYAKYPHIGPVLPALGYGPEQLGDLEQTIAAAGVDTVVVATPIDLAALIRIDRPVARVRYAFDEPGEPRLMALVDGWLAKTSNTP